MNFYLLCFSLSMLSLLDGLLHFVYLLLCLRRSSLLLFIQDLQVMVEYVFYLRLLTHFVVFSHSMIPVLTPQLVCFLLLQRTQLIFQVLVVQLIWWGPFRKVNQNLCGLIIHIWDWLVLLCDVSISVQLIRNLVCYTQLTLGIEHLLI